MHCLIIDDNPKTAESIKDMLQLVPSVTKVHKAVQPYHVRSLMEKEPIEVVLIRTRLWDYQVFERLTIMPVIVFLSGGKDKLTTQAGTTVPYQLREPYVQSEVTQLFRKLKGERIIESPAYFFVRHERKFHRVFFENIELIERLEMSYLKIWTRFTSFMISSTLNELLRQLPEHKFIRVSDTLILPVSQVNKIEGDSYVFRGRSIPLTFRFAAGARKEMEQQSNWASWPSK